MKKKDFKEDIFVIIVSIFLVTSFALLLISVNNKWNETIQNTFMVLVLLASIIIALFPLIRRNKTSIPEILLAVFCFAFLLIAVIVFASVATGTYRDPIIQISAAVVGGLLSLYGVGLTIKYNRLAKEKDDIEKAKPNVFPIGEQTWNSLPEEQKIEKNIEVNADLSNLKKAKRNDKYYSLAPLYLANSDLSMCTLKGIIINDEKDIVFQYDNIVLKGSNNCYIIDYPFVLLDDLETIQLVLGDMLGNTYGCFMSVFVDRKSNRNKTPIYLLSSLKIVPLDLKKFPIFKQPE